MNGAGYEPSVLTQEERTNLNSIQDAQSKSVRKDLIRNRSKVFAIKLVRSALQEKMDAVVRLAEQQGVRFACQPGCSHCCSTRVEVLAPEVFLLAEHLHSHRQADMPALIDALRLHADKAKGLRMDEYRIRCPLLDESNRCTVYQVRPTMCRKFNSLSVDACARHAGGESIAIPESQGVVLHAGALTVGIVVGYQRAGRLLGFHELGQSLLIALTDGDASDRWFRGEPVFPPIPESLD